MTVSLSRKQSSS